MSNLFWSSVIIISISPLVRADMCEDFCIRELGPDGCTKGSWCKNDHDCHSLFWTDQHRQAVCVFTGTGSCTNQFPVLCREASRGLSVSTTTTPTTVLGTHQSSAVFELRRRNNFSNPYVKLTFMNQGRSLGYYALFDTGCDRNIAQLEPPYSINQTSPLVNISDPLMIVVDGEPVSRRANPDEAYSLSYRQDPRLSGSPDYMEFGFENNPRRVEYCGTVSERIQLFCGPLNNFTFDDPQLYLVVQPNIERYRVLLGASFDSAFARAAGVFSLIPDSSDYQLYVGPTAAEDVESLCMTERLTWLPVIPHGQWVVEGSLELRNESFLFSQRVELVLDTGGTGLIFASGAIISRLIDSMEASGATRINPSPLVAGAVHIFENCTQFQQGQILPTFSILAGDHRADFEPSKYLEYVARNHSCALRIIQGDTNYQDNRILVSNSFFGQAITVFDRVHSRVGVCAPDFEEIDQRHPPSLSGSIARLIDAFVDLRDQLVR